MRKPSALAMRNTPSDPVGPARQLANDGGARRDNPGRGRVRSWRAARSPVAGGCSSLRVPCARRLARRMRGGLPLALSHSTGSAISSPSLSVPVTSITATGGSAPGRSRRRDRRSSLPPAAICLSSSLSAARWSPRMLKARAISRLPTLPGAAATNSRIAASLGKVGGAGFCFGLAEGLRFTPSLAVWQP